MLPAAGCGFVPLFFAYAAYEVIRRPRAQGGVIDTRRRLAAPLGPIPEGTTRVQLLAALEAANPRFSARAAARGQRHVALRMGLRNVPVVDRHGVQVCLGDRLTLKVLAADGTPRYGTAAVDRPYAPEERLDGVLETPEHGQPCAVAAVLDEVAWAALRLDDAQGAWAEIAQRGEPLSRAAREVQERPPASPWLMARGGRGHADQVWPVLASIIQRQAKARPEEGMGAAG